MTAIEKRAKGISILPDNPLSEHRPFYCSWYGIVFDEPDQPDILPKNFSTEKHLSIASKEK